MDVYIPKSLIERRLDVANDANPAIVVNDVMTTGQLSWRKVFRIAPSRFFNSFQDSLYSVIRWMPSAMPIAIIMTGINATISVIGLPTSAITPRVHVNANSTIAMGMKVALNIRNERYIINITNRITRGVNLAMSPLI